MQGIIIEIYRLNLLILFLLQLLIIPLGEIAPISYFRYRITTLRRSLILLTFWINMILLIYPNRLFSGKNRNLLLINIFF
jgi:hypothetical protein